MRVDDYSNAIEPARRAALKVSILLDSISYPPDQSPENAAFQQIHEAETMLREALTSLAKARELLIEEGMKPNL